MSNTHDDMKNSYIFQNVDKVESEQPKIGSPEYFRIKNEANSVRFNSSKKIQSELKNLSRKSEEYAGLKKYDESLHDAIVSADYARIIRINEQYNERVAKQEKKSISPFPDAQKKLDELRRLQAANK